MRQGYPHNANFQITSASNITTAASCDAGQMFHLSNIIVSIASANDGAYLAICNNATASALHTISCSVPAAGFLYFGEDYPLGTTGNQLLLHLYGAAAKVNITVQGFYR